MHRVVELGHEAGGLPISNRPESEEEILCARLDETATQAEHTFASARFAQAGIAGGNNDQPGSTQLQTADLLRGHDAVVARWRALAFGPRFQRVFRAREGEAA